MGGGILQEEFTQIVPFFQSRGSLNMDMIVDMILTVAVVALALGAVAEFQLRVGHIGAAADGAFVGVGGFRPGGGGSVRACAGEGNLLSPLA